MPDKTSVYLITGFLGSGKTTLLNQVINHFPDEKKLAILVNEFGEIGVDGTLVQGNEIEMMEISKGSIFCVCVKTDFIKGLYELNAKVRPDVLIIESTGVANPADLKKDLKLPIFDDRFIFREQFCLIDALHFIDAYQVYASLEKQIASSSVFIINKSELASTEKIQNIKDVISQFNPEPLYYETSYAKIPLNKFFDFSCLEPRDTYKSGEADRATPDLSADELEEFVENLLDSPDLQLTPPDLLVSAAYKYTGDHIDQIRDMVLRIPSSLIRAKGFIQIKNRIYIFNYVMGDWTIEKTDLPQESIKHKNIIIFIGSPDSIQKLEKFDTPGPWQEIGIFQPYAG
jgi:G3E family GTPase